MLPGVVVPLNRAVVSIMGGGCLDERTPRTQAHTSGPQTPSRCGGLDVGTTT